MEFQYPMDAIGEGALETARASDEVTKCIIIRCWDSQATFAHVVPCKGHDEEAYVANIAADDVAWLGYTTMMMKADNEASIQAVVTQVITRVRARLGEHVVIRREDPPPYDSHASGGTEVWGTQCTRTLQDPQTLPGVKARPIHSGRSSSACLAAAIHVCDIKR